jgi:hypothetical protein
MIGCFGCYFTDAHDFIACDADWILESVDVPMLEKSNVEAYVRWVEVSVVDNSVEKASKMFDVVHFFELLSY